MSLKLGLLYSFEYCRQYLYYIKNCFSPAFKSIKRQIVSYGLRGIKLLPDNAKSHIHFNVCKFKESTGLIVIDNPPYSPDLAPYDYWLFDYIKQRLGEKNDTNSLLR